MTLLSGDAVKSLESLTRRASRLCHDLARRVPELEGLCPLWEQNGEAIVGLLPDGRYVRFYYEDGGLENPGAAMEVLGRSYQQLVTSLLGEINEAGLWEEHAEVVAQALDQQTSGPEQRPEAGGGAPTRMRSRMTAVSLAMAVRQQPSNLSGKLRPGLAAAKED